MFSRMLKLPNRQSFFLFGARATGKSTLIRASFPEATYIDLLDPRVEDRYSRNPGIILEEWQDTKAPHTIIIDEIQKVPRLLDACHKLIFETEIRFIFTGSSARKLKAGHANLLAGRAVTRSLFPLTAKEVGVQFELNDALSFGTLPAIFSLEDVDEKRDYLEAYGFQYLKEEIWGEQIVRNLEPFRKFLEVAAQHNGKTLNFRSLSIDVGADPKTIKSYYQILEDTLVGFFSEAWHSSQRKRLRKKPKFYFFDCGVSRALCKMLSHPPKPRTSYYGELFEQFIVCEIYRLNIYLRKDFSLHYIQTESGVEVDLVVQRPGLAPILVEIKSTAEVEEHHCKNLRQLTSLFPESPLMLLSQDLILREIDGIKIRPWEKGLEEIFL